MNLSQITQVLSKTIGNVNIEIPMLLCCIFVILNCYALLCTVYGLLWHFIIESFSARQLFILYLISKGVSHLSTPLYVAQTNHFILLGSLLGILLFACYFFFLNWYNSKRCLLHNFGFSICVHFKSSCQWAFNSLLFFWSQKWSPFCKKKNNSCRTYPIVTELMWKL